VLSLVAMHSEGDAQEIALSSSAPGNSSASFLSTAHFEAAPAPGFVEVRKPEPSTATQSDADGHAMANSAWPSTCWKLQCARLPCAGSVETAMSPSTPVATHSDPPAQAMFVSVLARRKR
jgi:hypothetical protein